MSHLLAKMHIELAVVIHSLRYISCAVLISKFFAFQLRQIAKAQQADLTSASGGRQHQATHSRSVVVALQSRLASMTTDFKQVIVLPTLFVN